MLAELEALSVVVRGFISLKVSIPIANPITHTETQINTPAKMQFTRIELGLGLFRETCQDAISPGCAYVELLILIEWSVVFHPKVIGG